MILRLTTGILRALGLLGFVTNILLRIHSLLQGLVTHFACETEGGLHPKHRLTQYHEWFKGKLQKEWHVLDVGCGNGALTVDLAPACEKVLGIDSSSKSIADAKQRNTAANVEFTVADITDWTTDEAYDAIILSNVLEHLDNRVALLEKLATMPGRQAPHPVLLIRVPMLNRDWITLYKQERGVEYRLDRTHRLEYTVETLSAELEEAGLTVGSIEIRFGEIYCVGIQE